MNARERLAFALDVSTAAEATAWIQRLAPLVGVFKVGLELFIAEGPKVVDAVHAAGAACFLDLKLHDIRETVVRATQTASKLGVRYLTVHASNGATTLRAAEDVVAGKPTTLLAVTVLTNLGDDDVRALGAPRSAGDQAVLLAEHALTAGVSGFVCSTAEVARLRGLAGPGATIVVPGIRPEGTAAGDQTRIATPRAAIAAGASVLVVGRPIRDAQDAEAMAQAILADMAAAG